MDTRVDRPPQARSTIEILSFRRLSQRTRPRRFTEAGHSVFFAPAYRLVQELLAAKRDLDLSCRLRRLDNFDIPLMDDLG